MRTVFFCFLTLISFYLSADEEIHEFRGKHLVTNYLECDLKALSDEKALMQVMLTAVEKCGAQILDHNSYVFPGNGLTMTILLSESHASLHTYPEHGKCFVDLFTCGNKCDHDVFNEVLKSYLKPKIVAEKILVRDDAIKEHKVSNMVNALSISLLAATSILAGYVIMVFKRRKVVEKVLVQNDEIQELVP